MQPSNPAINMAAKESPNPVQPTSPDMLDDGVDDDEFAESVAQGLEKHLDTLTPEQQSFIVEYLTPETHALITLINGPEVGQYLKQYVDPNKSVQIVSNQPTQPPMQGQSPAPQGEAPQQGLMTPASPQPKAPTTLS